MRIFVIDDEVDVAETLGEVVADLGHHASLAHTAEAALTALEHEVPDAILLDIRLPGIDGLEFLRRRRPRETTAPVIGISGVATDAEVWECLRLGALDFVRKPSRDPDHQRRHGRVRTHHSWCSSLPSTKERGGVPEAAIGTRAVPSEREGR
jgi:CheY-like chemotaxis protein